MRRFDAADVGDTVMNDSLAWFALGALLQQMEDVHVVTPEDMARLEALKERIANLDPDKENP